MPSPGLLYMRAWTHQFIFNGLFRQRYLWLTAAKFPVIDFSWNLSIFYFDKWIITKVRILNDRQCYFLHFLLIDYRLTFEIFSFFFFLLIISTVSTLTAIYNLDSRFSGLLHLDYYHFCLKSRLFKRLFSIACKLKSFHHWIAISFHLFFQVYHYLRQFTLILLKKNLVFRNIWYQKRWPFKTIHM